MITPTQLLSFEAQVAREYAKGHIRYPIHLQGGQNYAEKMIKAFMSVKPQDWICCGWRSHWQCLLKGVPETEVMRAIKEGHSIAMCFSEYNIISSAIAGGILPIAVGIAFALKRKRSGAMVHCWLGDMTAAMGIFYECEQYATGHKLPIRFFIEDNAMSIKTPTAKVLPVVVDGSRCHYFYTYKSIYPHSGIGKKVRF